MALATTLRVTKWAMVRLTREIVTNTVASITIILAFAVVAANFIGAAATTIVQRRHPQHSHSSGCCYHPPLQHCNQTAMVWAMATEAMATAMRVAGEQWRQLQ
jgi:hypothetical protein